MLLSVLLKPQNVLLEVQACGRSRNLRKHDGCRTGPQSHLCRPQPDHDFNNKAPWVSNWCTATGNEVSVTGQCDSSPAHLCPSLMNTFSKALKSLMTNWSHKQASCDSHWKSDRSSPNPDWLKGHTQDVHERPNVPRWNWVRHKWIRHVYITTPTWSERRQKKPISLAYIGRDL